MTCAPVPSMVRRTLEARMATITLKNIPDDLHRRLKERAARHRRSLNGEILASLEMVVKSEPVDPRAFIARIRSLRPRGEVAPSPFDFDVARGTPRR